MLSSVHIHAIFLGSNQDENEVLIKTWADFFLVYLESAFHGIKSQGPLHKHKCPPLWVLHFQIDPLLWVPYYGYHMKNYIFK